MDPGSIGPTVAALVGAQAMGGFATEAGTRAWDAVQRMAGSLRGRLSPRGAQALAQLEEGKFDPSTANVLAAEIQITADADPALGAALEDLIAQAEKSKPLASIIAVARENSRQVNIGGDNSGEIKMA